MKISAFKNGLFWILLPLLFIFSWGPAFPEQDSVVKTYKNATAPFDDEKRVDSVLLIPNSTVQVKTKYQGGLFRTETRKDKIERFKCSQCHNNKNVQVARAAEIAHGNITLDHGGQDKPLSCYTCHKRMTAIFW